MSRRLGDDPLARARVSRAAQASGGIPLDAFTGARTSYNDILFLRRGEAQAEAVGAVEPAVETLEISEISEIPEIREAAAFQETATTQVPLEQEVAPEAPQDVQEAQDVVAPQFPIIAAVEPNVSEAAEAPVQQEPAPETDSASLPSLAAVPASSEEPAAQEQNGTQGA